MNQVVVFYNPFLPELKVSVNGRPLSSYSAIMRYRHSRAGVWCTDLFTELYREANGPFHMTCVSTPFVCGWMEQIAEKAEHCQGFSAKELPLCESVYERLARLELLGYEDGEEIAVPVWNASGDRAMVSAAFEIVEEEGLFSVDEGGALSWDGCPLVQIRLCEARSESDIPYQSPFVMALCGSAEDCLPVGGEYDVFALVMGSPTRFLRKSGRCVCFEVDPDDLGDVVVELLAEQALCTFLSGAAYQFPEERKALLTDREKEQLELLTAAAPVCRAELPDLLDPGYPFEVAYTAYPSDAQAVLHIHSDAENVVAAEGNVIKGVQEGSARVDVYYGEDPYPAASKVITVCRRELIQRIRVFPSTLYLPVGGEKAVEVTYEPTGAEDASEIRWKSSDGSVASVNQTDGTVRGLQCGSCELTVFTKGAESRVSVQVQPAITDITCPCSRLEVRAGEQAEWRYSVVPEHAYGADTLKIFSSDKNVAEYRGGYVIGKHAGECRICIRTADGSVSRELRVAVRKGKRIW